MITLALTVKVGRTYVINDQTINDILGRGVTAQRKKIIDAAVRKAMGEYGDVLKRLGSE